MNALFTSALVATSPQTFRAVTLHWQEPLATRLRLHHQLPGATANRLLNVELGLYLMNELLPMAPPEALPGLLNGAGAAYSERPVWTPRQHRMLSRARALLQPYQDRTLWFNAIDRYATLPTHLRVFSLTGRWNHETHGLIQQERLRLFRGALA